MAVNAAQDEKELSVYGYVRNALRIVCEQKYIEHYRHMYILHNHALNLSEYI